MLKKRINRLLDPVYLYKDKYIWRKTNSHNNTWLEKRTNMDVVKVGKYSYGPLEVYTWNDSNEGLVIGNYVSISNDVKFILGGNHRYDGIMTYPFKVNFMGKKSEAYTNGKIIIEDDVWIGMNTMILSGVKIGKGAVVAAGSVVCKDVPNYSIVGGNPAKVIRYRFSEEIIDKIKEFDLLTLDEQYIKKNLKDFYTKVDIKLVNKIINFRGE